ncbi:MAG TPA: AAA family ATPase [Patescibacteria group bacterium]|nr:AAA family ATPase [Patescibacteria group bacterium]
MFETIAGHAKQKQLLTKSIESGKIAHAYVFAGPGSVGKRLIAKGFANALLGMSDEGRGMSFHPDLLEIAGDEPVKIEQIRELIYKLSLQPYQAKYKIALIDNAENMTTEAQNALLKALEEPKSYTVMILVTEAFGKLLGTITSRAQKLNFGLVRPADFQALLPANLPECDVKQIAEFAAGRPGLAVRIANDSDLRETLSEINNNLEIIKSQDLPAKLKLAYDLAELETVELRQQFDFWLARLEQDLLTEPGKLPARYISAVARSRKHLDQNANSKLLLTNLMLQLN